jgi:DNA-binding response OmpR family regulator
VSANGSVHHPRGSVLVVDDEPTIAEVVARYLDRAGYEARIAGDGPQALELAGAQRPDLVVLDLMLPGMDGLEVMRRLRDSAHDRVAVILLTAKGEESDRVIGLRLGADDYVVKPFSPAELVARVDAVLRRIDPVPETRLAGGRSSAIPSVSSLSASSTSCCSWRGTPARCSRATS